MNYQALRKEMIEEQLIRRGISQPQVLSAIQKVPRHRFVPVKHLDSAYGDFPLPVGNGQTISQPYMVALMTQSLELRGPESVLEIGTGSGYQAAILAEVAQKVYSVERIPALAKGAEKILQDLGYRNVSIRIADGTLGWETFAPYEAIIVTAAAPSVPKPLLKQLKPQGKLIMPIGATASQILTLFQKRKDKIETREICACVFVPLVGKYGWPKQND